MDCLKCKKEIVETAMFNGVAQRKLGEGKKFLHDGENEYVLCPYCGVKNILSTVTPGASGAMRLAFTRYEK